MTYFACTRPALDGTLSVAADQDSCRDRAPSPSRSAARNEPPSKRGRVRSRGPILDLYAGLWLGEPLMPDDDVLSADEKTRIQAPRRRHALSAAQARSRGENRT